MALRRARSHFSAAMLCLPLEAVHWLLQFVPCLGVLRPPVNCQGIPSFGVRCLEHGKREKEDKGLKPSQRLKNVGLGDQTRDHVVADRAARPTTRLCINAEEVLHARLRRAAGRAKYLHQVEATIVGAAELKIYESDICVTGTLVSYDSI